MKDFFKTGKCKILGLLLALLFAFTLHAAYSGTAVPLLSRIAGVVVSPLQTVTAHLSYSFQNFFTETFRGSRLARENEALSAEIAVLEQKLIAYDRVIAENEQMKQYLKIQEQNPDFSFEPATVVGRDNADRFFSFTINKGSKDGVKKGAPVINSRGLVGVVADAQPYSARVLTLLDVLVEVGATDSVSRDIGITGGSVAAAVKGQLSLYFLPRDAKAAVGDRVVTTGVGGIFPRDLLIGTISEIVPDGKGMSLTATLEPPVDLRRVRDVFVIKDFQTATED